MPRSSDPFFNSTRQSTIIRRNEEVQTEKPAARQAFLFNTQGESGALRIPAHPADRAAPFVLDDAVCVSRSMSLNLQVFFGHSVLCREKAERFRFSTGQISP